MENSNKIVFLENDSVVEVYDMELLEELKEKFYPNYDFRIVTDLRNYRRDELLNIIKNNSIFATTSVYVDGSDNQFVSLMIAIGRYEELQNKILYSLYGSGIISLINRCYSLKLKTSEDYHYFLKGVFNTTIYVGNADISKQLKFEPTQMKFFIDN